MKKIILLLFLSFIFLGYSYSFNVFNVNINGFADNLKNKLSGLHFNGGGSDFGGMMFITERKNLSDTENVSLLGNTKNNCSKKLRGYYWNNLRGDAIFPIDKETMNYWTGEDSDYYSGLSITGGFYTSCDSNSSSIFGQIEYYGDHNFKLQAGRKYDVNTNNVTGTDFANNFQIYDSAPIGFIMDSTYGVGFVGGKFTSGWNDFVSEVNNDSINNVVTSIDTNINNTVGANIIAITNTVIEAIMGMAGYFNISGEQTEEIKEQIKNIEKANKAILGGKKVIQVNDLINSARKNSYKLCQGNWQDITEIDTSYRGENICIKTDNNTIKIKNDLNLNTTKSTEYTNIIVKGDNNKIIFKQRQYGSGYINLFLDDGYVLFDNDASSLMSVGKNGNMNKPYVTSGFVFKGNMIVNGLIGGYSSGSGIEPFEHKLYIKGSLASLNTLAESENRIKYLSGDLLSGIYEEDTTNLQDSFSWRCSDSGLGTDDVPCGDVYDKYGKNSLIVQKKNLFNPFWGK